MGTQLDGLAHVGIENTFYNGRNVGDFVTSTGVTELGIEGIPPMVTRGVLLNVASYRGVDRMAAGDAIDGAEIEAIAAAQNITIEEGDVVILHTGWLSLVGTDNDAFMAGEPGLNRDGAEFLVSRGVVAVGTDTAYIPRYSPETKLRQQGRFTSKWWGAWHRQVRHTSTTSEDHRYGSLAWTNWPLVTVGLVMRGYSEKDIRNILGLNLVRVLEANQPRPILPSAQ